MKFVGLLIFAVLFMGSESFDLEAIGAELQSTIEAFSDFLVPLQTKSENLLRSADDCLKLTNTSEQAYDFATNFTHFGVDAVKSLGNAMNTLINCANEDLFKQLNCVIDQFKVVRQQVLDLEQEAQPYLDQGSSLYSQLTEEIQDCL